MKTTRKIVNNQFIRLCNALGKPIAENYNDVGAWRLDYANGLYSIEEIISSTGAVTHPFSNAFLKGSEMYEYINFALRAIQLDRKGDPHVYWPVDKN